MRIPSKIMNDLDDRTKNALSELGQDLKLAATFSKEEFLKNHRDINKRMSGILNAIYAEHGYATFMKVCNQLKTVGVDEGDDFAVSDYSKARGELAEVVCEYTIKEFVAQHGIKNWSTYRGLILNDPTRPNSNFSTEMDVVLLTPVVVCVIECKSYFGDKTLVDKCSIKTKSRVKDVYSQNVMHTEVFLKNFKNSLRVSTGCVKSVLFSFAHGKLTDNRTLNDRGIMPCITEENLVNFLMSVKAVSREPAWDYTRLVSDVYKASENPVVSIEEHIEYVNSLRAGNV